ncbi:MAG: hypothetical protein AAF492_06470, partial [Verrucomicrobiota bacterium]
MKSGIIVLLAAILFTGCNDSTPTPTPESSVTPAPLLRVNGEKAFEDVKAFVELGPRDSGTPGAEKAAYWLKNRLLAAGTEAEIDAFEDPSPEGVTTFRNVIGTIRGTGNKR